MEKYIDAEKLIAEIDKRLMSVNLEELGNFGSHRVWAYNDVKDIITSLQQKQPAEGLEEEIENYFGNIPDDTDKIDIARHFAEWGATHLKR